MILTEFNFMAIFRKCMESVKHTHHYWTLHRHPDQLILFRNWGPWSFIHFWSRIFPYGQCWFRDFKWAFMQNKADQNDTISVCIFPTCREKKTMVIIYKIPLVVPWKGRSWCMMSVGSTLCSSNSGFSGTMLYIDAIGSLLQLMPFLDLWKLYEGLGMGGIMRKWLPCSWCQRLHYNPM